MSDRFQVIVVGVGAVGSAACLELARRGVRVLGLDRSSIPNAMGSSHGQSRILRLCYYEHPDYVPLLRRAHALWQAFEPQFEGPILRVTGALYMGPPQCDLVRSTIAAAVEHDLPHEILDRRDLDRRFGQFTVPDDHVAVLDPSAGVLHPERIIAGFADFALRRGAELHGHETVTDWRVEDGGVSVRTDRGAYHADHLILCTGAWMPALLGDAGVRLTVTRQPFGWLWPRQPERFTPDRMPIWGIDDAEGFFYYGFPMLPDHPGIKLARHYEGTTATADDLDRSIRPHDEVELRRLIERYLPDADGSVLSMSVCMYTNTPDRHFVVDRHPRHAEVSIAGGFSGHGFKFAPVMGEILADLAIDGATRHPIAFLGLAGR